MTEQRQIEVLLEQAYGQRKLANWRGAIELNQRALALDPSNASAHASLAFSLLGARRLQGAGIEARAALALDGNDPYCHYAAASVMQAERKLDDAWQHCLVALEADNTDVDIRVLGASIRSQRNEVTEARELLHEALELSPNHVDALATLARLELDDKNIEKAAGYIAEALRHDASDHDAHIVAGLIDIVRGDDASAETHARFVLSQDSTSHGALHLWASIKARRSILLGLWWRFSVWVSVRSETGQLMMVMGTFIAANLALIFALHFDLDTIAKVIGYGWLGFCAYTWFAPEIFRWMLQNDLGTVTLDPDY